MPEHTRGLRPVIATARSTRIRGMVCALFYWLVALTSVWAASPAVSLRTAINALILRYADQYPLGPQWLAQLDGLESQFGAGNPAESAPAQATWERLQRAALLAHPRLRNQPLLFVVRQQYTRDHHNTATFFPAAQHEFNNGHFTPGGALKVLDLAAGGAVRTLLETTDGVIRDPEVHFDGRKIVFALRRNAQDSYHLYEINADGTGLRQLTAAPDVDDFDPLYLPDDSLVFSSTREPKYCMCNRHIMANLFRMGPDGANIHQIGKSTLFEGHAALLPDGRILYDRWEYVDRNFGDAQALWTVHPDGTSHAVFWGNNTASPGAVLDARAVPGTEQILCVFSSCHDRPWGALVLVDRQLGLDGRAPVLRTWPADATNLIQQSGWELFDRFMQVKLKYEDPWPLDDQFFLCARMTGQGEQMGIYLVDIFGNEVLVHTEAPGCFDPMPLAVSPRPPVLTRQRDFANGEGFFYVQNVYHGTHTAGVKPGTVKWLRIVESPEKRTWTGPAWNGQGQQAPAMNWHDFNNKRILGTVPVAADGSAYFTVPADRFVYFQLLDANRMMVQSMRSGTIVQSGEQMSCIGCHEDRRTAPPLPGTPTFTAHGSVPSAESPGATGPLPQALRQGPLRPRNWHGPPREFNYLAEVQPVFDQHCVRCHDFGQPAGDKLNLARDRDLVFNVSYNELWRKQYLRAIGAGPADIQPAYSWGSHASKLVAVIRDNPRCGSTLAPVDFERIVTWIDLNAPYYPSYASAYPDHLAGRSPLTPPQLTRLGKLTGVPFKKLAGHNSNRGPQVSFDRPALSPCLKSIPDASGPKYQEALAIIMEGAAALARRPEADMEAFVASELDQWREEKYLSRQAQETQRRAALRQGQNVYDTAKD